VLRTTKGLNITTFNYDTGQTQQNLPIINWCKETHCWLLHCVCDAVAGLLVQYFLFHNTHNILKEQEMLLIPFAMISLSLAFMAHGLFF
jgi:hypothetical protein